MKHRVRELDNRLISGQYKLIETSKSNQIKIQTFTTTSITSETTTATLSTANTAIATGTIGYVVSDICDLRSITIRVVGIFVYF